MRKRFFILLLAFSLLLTASPAATAADDSTPPSWITNGTSSGDAAQEDRDDRDDRDEQDEETTGDVDYPQISAPAVDAVSGGALITNDHVAYLSGSSGLFRPQDNLTRAEAAQIFLRLLRQKVPVTVRYTDVPADAWYAEAAGVMGSMGVMRSGMSTFAPNEALTRGEFISCVAQFFAPRTDAVQFSDVSSSYPYAAYILSARAWGWVEGFSDGTLRPSQLITRAEAVTILNRALGRTADLNYLSRTYPAGLYLDVPTTSWAYAEVMEASVAHTHVPSAVGETWTSHTKTDIGLASGFHLIDGWLYYYDANAGAFAVNTSVGNFTFNSQGRFTSGSDDLDQKLHDIVLAHTNDSMTQEQKLRALYVYTRDSFTYLRRSPYEFGATGWMQTDALNMLNTGYGNCYCYAAVFWYLARWLGYDARIYSGTVGWNYAPHAWVEITMDGTSYIYDTELEMAYHRKGRYEINLYKYIDVDGWHYVKP